MANIFIAAGTVAVTGVIGRRVGGPAAGLLSAALVAGSPLAVDVTVLVRNDPGMALIIMATTWAALVYAEGGRPRWSIWAGALAGVAGAIKYSCWQSPSPNHFIWSDFPNLLRQLSDQVAITGRGHYAASDNPAAFYGETLIRMGTGRPLVLLAAGFAVSALSTRQPQLWIVVSFPLLYTWFMTGRPSQFPRWVYPMLVAQEHLFNHPTLQHMSLVKRFEAGQSFGANTGIDYGVYSIRRPTLEGPCGNDSGGTTR